MACWVRVGKVKLWFAAHLRESVHLDYTAPLIGFSHALGVLGERLVGLRVDPLLDSLAEAQVGGNTVKTTLIPVPPVLLSSGVCNLLLRAIQIL